MPIAPMQRCAETGCPELVPAGRCDEHERPAWHGRPPFEQRYGMSRREWDTLAARILRRDEWTCYVCARYAATPEDREAMQVDHKLPVFEGGSPRDPENLGAICAEPCHAAKTRAESIRAAQRARQG